MQDQTALHYSKEEFLEWGKNNGLLPEVVQYLEAQDHLGGATPRMWMEYSKLTTSFNDMKNKPGSAESKINFLKVYLIQANEILGKDIYNQFIDWHVEREIAEIM